MRWIPVENFERYEVSDSGLVRQVITSTKVKAGQLIPQSTSKGYKVVSLTKDGKQTQWKVHRLVAIAFLPPPENPSQDMVAHNDGTRDNNHFTNLRWATCKENLSDRKKHKTTLDGLRNGRVKLTPEQVIEIRARYKPRHPTDSAKAMAEEFGVTDVAIIKAFRGENWKSIP